MRSGEDKALFAEEHRRGAEDQVKKRVILDPKNGGKVLGDPESVPGAPYLVHEVYDEVIIKNASPVLSNACFQTPAPVALHTLRGLFCTEWSDEEELERMTKAHAVLKDQIQELKAELLADE